MAQARNNIENVPVLCRLWPDGGVWNATAIDLPVVVFGMTFEEALQNLSDAVYGHIATVAEFGDIAALASELKERASEHTVSLTEFAPHTSYTSLSASFHDHSIVAVV